MTKPKNILVIKHGAFGDIVKSLGAFQLIRSSHPKARITLLTMPLFEAFCRKTGFFDAILLDKRAHPLSSLKLLNSLLQQKFDLIYDLQGSQRTAFYFKYLNWKRPTPWSGNAPGCQYFQDPLEKKRLHPFERLADQLRIAGLDLKGRTSLLPDLSWLQASSTFDLPTPFVLMIPGSSPHTLAKRWPASFYGNIAQRLVHKGIKSVVIGSANEAPLAQIIKDLCPSILDLTGQTHFEDILSIAQQSLAVIGNDTGPTFLACAAGKPTLVPWSDYCSQELNAPRGEHVRILYEPHLKNLSPDRVWTALQL